MHLTRSLLAAGASSACLSLVLLASCTSDEVGTAPIAQNPDAAAQTDAAVRPDADAEADKPDAAPDGAVTGGCASFAQAYCARLDACASGFFFPTRYLDIADCENTTAAECTLERAAPGIAVKATALDSCNTDLAAFSCSKVLARQLPESCGAKGTLANGTACGADSQCATGFCALTSPACGTCADAPALGSRCASGRCGSGASCTFEVAEEDRRCVPIALEVGAACGETAYCRVGLDCVNGSCAAGLAEGAPCTFDAPDQPDCDLLAGLRCNGFTANAVCERPTYVAAGQACGATDIETDAGLQLARTECRADGVCPQEPGDTTCIPRGALGEACGESLQEPCRTGLSCVEGRCALLDPSACR